MGDYDILGNIAIIKGDKKTKKQKLRQAEKLLEKKKIKTVIEKIGKIKGRLRTINIKHIKGEKNLIANYNENSCRLEFNVADCYFSPRLSEERKLIAGKIKKSDRVLVMFAGIGVYPIVIYKYIKPKKIAGIEIGKKCCYWFKKNLKLNKIPDKKIEIIQGDVKKKINEKLGKFEVVIMTRPNLKETFLKWGLKASKKGTRLFYYGFCNIDEIKNLIKNLINESKNLKRKIKLIKFIRAGDIAPYKFRYRIEFKVLN